MNFAAFLKLIKVLVVVAVLGWGTNAVGQEDIFGDSTDIDVPDSGDLGDSLTDLEAGAQEESPEAKAYREAMDAGRSLQAQGNWAESVVKFQEANAMTGGQSPESYLEMGRSYFNLELTNEAINALSNAVLLPGSASIEGLLLDAYLLRGQLYLKSPNQYPEAAEDFALAVQADPNSPEAHYFSGRAGLLQAVISISSGSDQIGRASLAAAMSAQTKAIELKSDYGEAYLDRGRVLIRLRQVALAVEDFEKAVQYMGQGSQAVAELAAGLKGRAGVEARKKNPSQAEILQDYRQSTSLIDQFLNAHPPGKRRNPWEDVEPLDNQPNAMLLARAENYVKIGDELNRDKAEYRKAIGDCDTFLGFTETAPSEKAQAHFTRGLAFRMLEDNDKALEDFEMAIFFAKQTERPYYPEANLRRGIIHYRNGDYDLALNDFEEAKFNLLNPFLADPRAMFWIGLTRVAQDDLPKAIESYTRAITGYNEYQLAYLNRGLTYMKMGQYERALNDFDTTIRLDGSNQKAKQYREAALDALSR